MSDQVTTLTFFRYPKFFQRAWAFTMMQFAQGPLNRTEDLVFYRLLGTGKGETFNPRPEWSVYGLLQVWPNEATAEKFLSTHPLMARYRRVASEAWTIFMTCQKAHGEWARANPFEEQGESANPDAPVAAITRATIRLKSLPKFWKYVPTSQAPLANAEGLVYKIGIGEVPIAQMATFSIWESTRALKAYAYQSPEHMEAIRKTRELGWYKEELFSRFTPYRSEGSWGGRDFGELLMGA